MPAQPAWPAALTSISVSQLALLHATTLSLPASHGADVMLIRQLAMPPS